MQSFHGDKAIKEKYLARVEHHIAADNLIRGDGWNGEKGCAVGCTLEKYEHKAYEDELGIPEWLAHVEDILFEDMSEEKSKTWPKVFLEAIPIGVDLNQARTPFMVMLLEHCLDSLERCVVDKDKNPDVAAALQSSKDAVRQMIEAQKSGDSAKIEAAWSAAWSARSAALSAESARSAAWSARSAALSAESARSAAESARSAAWSAAWSAAESARSALSAESAARSAAESARSAALSAESAMSAAMSAAYDHYADRLINILSNLPQGEAVGTLSD